MLYLGIDQHKNHSTFCCINSSGHVIESRKIYNSKEMIESFLNNLPTDEPIMAVVEAGSFWHVMYDTLEEIDRIDKIILANPSKVKIIASSKIKTDKIDAEKLAQLLRGNLIPEVWIQPKDIRVKKYTARFRIFVVKEKTKLKNRIHNLISRNHLQSPEVTDLFGKHGIEWLKTVSLDETERKLLDEHLKIYEFIEEEQKIIEKELHKQFDDDEDISYLRSIPGIGFVFSALITLEIGDINRFPDVSRLHSYCGLVPSTFSSGEKTYHGHLLKSSNSYLKWVFIEAALAAVKRSIYFSSHYYRIRSRNGSQAAAVSTARKLASVVFSILKDKRNYVENYSALSPSSQF